MRFGTLALAGALSAFIGQSALGADALVSYRPLVLDGHILKWGEPLLGKGARVSYAIVESERRFPAARNCAGIGPVDGLLSRNGIIAARFRSELTAAFRAWESVSDITFVAADPATANILIGRQIKPRGRAFTNVSYDASAGPAAIGRLTRALICLNPAERWKIGFDGDLDVYDLRYTLMHEIGHAIGLNHPAVRDVLMHFAYSEKFRTLQAGDIDGAVELYGPSLTAPMIAARPAPQRVAGQSGAWGEAAFVGPATGNAGLRH